MNRIRVLSAIGGVALAISAAACGSSASHSNSSHAAGAGSSGVALRTVQAGGLSVLANRTGMPLYSPAQESSGEILCTNANGCTAFWKPLIVTSSPSRALQGVGKLGVIKLANGARQLTVNSRPLYTFVQDKPGQLNGNGFRDAFGGQHFTWHVILSSGNAAGSASSGSSGAGASTSGGGYNPYG
jgi:predicted lipoprotein with Yx(FWY)xxD motif